MVGSPPALQLPDELLRRGDGLRGDGRDPALSAFAACRNKGANGSQPCALARTLLLPGHRQPRPGLQDGVRGNANAGLAVQLDVRPQFRQKQVARSRSPGAVGDLADQTGADGWPLGPSSKAKLPTWRCRQPPAANRGAPARRGCDVVNMLITANSPRSGPFTALQRDRLGIRSRRCTMSSRRSRSRHSIAISRGVCRPIRAGGPRIARPGQRLAQTREDSPGSAYLRSPTDRA
jgi:hypothetical protein